MDVVYRVLTITNRYRYTGGSTIVFANYFD